MQKQTPTHTLTNYGCQLFYSLPGSVVETWRRVWGDGEIFCGPRFLKKIPFSRPNFWWPGFSNFPILFPDFPYLYYVEYRIWHFPQKKNHYFRKDFLYDTFFYSVRTFARIRQHYFSKYWGDGCAGRPPTSNFGETVPPVPTRSPPLIRDTNC